MYERGDIYVGFGGDTLSEEEQEYVYSRGERVLFYDARDETSAVKDLPKVAYLEHSCDEWIIGGPEQIVLMIRDLSRVHQGLTGKWPFVLMEVKL